MIDIHCHILPGVDDGADSLKTALEMARMAVDSGVKAIIATPHCNIPDAPNRNHAGEAMTRSFEQFQEALRQASLPLKLYPGAEILCTPDTALLLRQGKLPTLAGSRYLLVEFFFDETLQYMSEQLDRIAAEGVVPIIAHPERYTAFQQTPFVAELWFSKGYLLQINKGSIQGRLGQRAASTDNWLLSQGLAHVVASDAHNAYTRTPYMDRINGYLCDVHGEEYADILLRENPQRILMDLPVVEA